MTEKEQGKTTSKIAGEINAEMMKTTRATQSLTDRMVQEIESLRQQLASCDAEIERLKTVPMRYRRMAFNAQLQNENTQLCQQLAAALAAIKVLRDIAEQSRGSVKFDLNRYEQLLTIKQKVGVEKSAQYIAMEIEANRLSKTIDGIDEALADTADLKDVILCHSEPAGYTFQHEDTGRTMCVEAHQVEWNFEKNNPRLFKVGPLYRAWEPK